MQSSLFLVLAFVYLTTCSPTGKLIVKFRDGTSKREVHEMYGGDHEHRVDLISADIVAFPSPEHAQEALEKYTRDPNVLYAEADAIGYGQATNDPFFANLWAFQPAKLNIEKVWADHRVDGTGVTVAVIDTGVMYTHEDLAGQVLTNLGYDFVNNDADAMDDNGHGSHIAGTIAAVRNNMKGITGIAPGAKIIPIKVLDHLNGGTYANWIKGIDHAIAKGAKIINLSLGGNSFSQPLADAVAAANSRGVFLACAMGNQGEAGSPVLYPAAMPGCNAVANYQSDNTLHPASSRGNHCKIAAPGTSIYSTILSSGYQWYYGTSMATPHVAAVVALLYQKRSTLTTAQVTQLLTLTAIDAGPAGFDTGFGYGYLNPYGALNAISPATTGVQTTGVQTTGVQTTGVQTTGVQTTGIRTTGIQTTGVQTTGVQTAGGQTTGFQYDSSGDAIIYYDRVVAPFKAAVSTNWVNFQSTKKVDAGITSMALDTSNTFYGDLSFSCDSVCFNPSIFASVSFRYSGRGVTFYAVNAAGKPMGAKNTLNTVLGAWKSYTFTFQQLTGSTTLAPSKLVFSANSGVTAYVDTLVLDKRPFPLGGAVYEQEPDATLISSNPSLTASLTPWQFSTSGSESFTITSDAEHIPGDQPFVYEAEITVNSVSHRVPLELVNIGKLQGYTPQVSAAGSFAMKILRSGDQLFADDIPIQTYDCSQTDSCDVCVKVGPQCLWCQGSCSDIRGSACPLEEQITPCEQTVSSLSAATSLLASVLLLALALFVSWR